MELFIAVGIGYTFRAQPYTVLFQQARQRGQHGGSLYMYCSWGVSCVCHALPYEAVSGAAGGQG